MRNIETISGASGAYWKAGPKPASSISPERRPAAQIWAVGGGKGGVGKSVVASNLAAALAADGLRCALIDADLGGSNAHTLLGVARPPRTLSHFLNGSVTRLEQVMCPTSVPNLWLVSGARAIFDSANLAYARKQKLLRHIASLDVDHVVLDLGAGTSFNVLDFFLAATRGIVVTTPEPTALENTYHFLKATFFRSLKQFVKAAPVREALEQVLAEGGRSALTPRRLIARAASLDAEVGRLLLERSRAFSPLLIVNQVAGREPERLTAEIASNCRTHLGCEIEPLASLEYAEQVPEAVRRQLPVMQLYPGCPFSRGLRTAAERLRGQRPRDPADVGSGDRPAQPAGRERIAGPEPRVGGAPEVVPQPGARPFTPLDRLHPGRYLRRRREQLGLAIALLSERTRIRPLHCIEQERFDELPPEPYVRGYVLAYARALGIAEPGLVAASYLECWRRATRPGVRWRREPGRNSQSQATGLRGCGSARGPS